MSIPDPIRIHGDVPDNVVRLPRKSGPRKTNRGRKFDPDPIRVDDVAQLLTHCTPQIPGRYGYLSAMRLRALIVILYRTGVRISEALAFIESDVMNADQALLVRHGKGDKRRIVLIDEWGWDELQTWMHLRTARQPDGTPDIPAGALIPVLRGRTAGQPLSDTDARRQLRDLQARAGIRRRIAPHQFRHGFAVENFREGTNLLALQKQLGHAHLGITEIYLRGIDPLTVLEPIGRRQPPRIVIPPQTGAPK
jgi:site-specific recombinase XerD